MSTDETEARVDVVDGQLVLVDPVAEAVFEVVAAHNRGIDRQNCLATVKAHADRVAHFAQRVGALGLSPRAALIVLLNMDEPFGALIGNNLMPGHDWAPYRERGEVPYARGLAERAGIEAWIEDPRPGAGRELADIEGLAILVIDHGAIVSFPTGIKTL